jgi:long-chain acyl-CoA synthetase
MGKTLDLFVRRNARRFPHKRAVVMGERVLTWAELDERVDRLADALLSLGLLRDARVAALLHNCPEYYEIYFGSARAGCIVVPVSYRLTVPELCEVLAVAEPTLLIVHAGEVGKAEALLGLLPGLHHVWVVGDGGEAIGRPYEEMLASASPTARVSPQDEDDTFSIFFTSGTTGLPKGATVSHLNLEANGYNQFVADESRADDINLISSPLYHMGAVFISVTYMMLGCTHVIIERFDPAAWLEAVQEHGCTVALLIPTMLNAVVNFSRLGEYELSSLRRVFYGGGPMPPAVLRKALQSLPCGFTQGYGLTETLEATFLVAADHVLDGTDEQERRLASAGREAVGAEVRIVDEQGREQPPGTPGEIIIRSRSNVAGYWSNAAETAQAIRGEWFYTGDIGYLDDDRYLFVVDRKKDIVVSGGVNIYTKEIEAVLYTHPAVLEAAVIGLPDDQWGEAVTACVVLKPEKQTSAEELIDHCKATLASYKKPRLVVFLDDLPKNPSGKILKRELRQTMRVDT